jgi:hypothetical protein
MADEYKRWNFAREAAGIFMALVRRQHERGNSTREATALAFVPMPYIAAGVFPCCVTQADTAAQKGGG